MEDNTETSKLKIMYTLPSGVTGDIYLDQIPNIGNSVTIGNRTYRVIEGHDSMVKTGSHSSFPLANWDYVITVA